MINKFSIINSWITWNLSTFISLRSNCMLCRITCVIPKMLTLFTLRSQVFGSLNYKLRKLWDTKWLMGKIIREFIRDFIGDWKRIDGTGSTKDWGIRFFCTKLCSLLVRWKLCEGNSCRKIGFMSFYYFVICILFY